MDDMRNLFGSDEEEEEEEGQGAQVGSQQPGSQPESQVQHDASLDDDDETLHEQQRPSLPEGSDDYSDEGRRQQERPQPTLAGPMEVCAPLLPLPQADSIALLRPTNIVSLQPRCFDPATHEREEETFVDESGRRRVRLADNAVIRWRMRQLPDGTEVRQSNARFVRWEDGSLQLFLGKEVLDVAEQDNSQNNNYLFAHTKGIIQGQTQLTTKLALRPASLDSGLHRRLRDEVDKRHGKTYRVAMHGGMQNPEAHKARVEAVEEERIKAQEALQRKQERAMAKAYGGARGPRNPRLRDDYLEQEQDWEQEDGDGEEGEEEEGMSAGDRARMSLSRNRRALADEDAEEAAAQRLQAAKRGPLASEAGAPAPPGGQRRGSKRSRRLAGSDEEDEDGGGEEALDEGDDFEEEEYKSEDDESGGGSDEDEGGDDDEKEAEEEKEEGKDKGKGAKKHQEPEKKKRRHVVMSDDDD
mmetsp:Transcript_17128/g.44849  ORF Transcript_17128/g.44849 Transcript_17128/m.44849 type:complete len:470 (+) Transcript_17128:48-1457(+)